MMKRVCALLAVLSLLTACIPAVAVEYMTSEEREEEYQVTIEALQMYLNGDNLINLDGLYMNLIEQIPSYKMSTQLAYYIRVLSYIETGEFDLIEIVLNLLSVDEEFVVWLEETEVLGTLEQVRYYAEGRKAEVEGRIDDAIAAYIECGNFHDAVLRRMELSLSGQSVLVWKYNEALRLYRNGMIPDALALMREVAVHNYGQSVEYVALMETLLPERSPSPDNSATITVSNSEISCAAAGESRTLSVTANGSWTVGSDRSWIKVSKSGNRAVIVEVAANTDKNSMREGTLTFTCGTATATVVVHQARAASSGQPTKTAPPAPTIAPPTACSHAFTTEVEGPKVYESNGNWEQEVNEICIACGAVVDTYCHIGVTIDAIIPTPSNSWEYEDDGPTPCPVP